MSSENNVSWACTQKMLIARWPHFEAVPEYEEMLSRVACMSLKPLAVKRALMMRVITVVWGHRICFHLITHVPSTMLDDLALGHRRKQFSFCQFRSSWYFASSTSALCGDRSSFDRLSNSLLITASTFTFPLPVFWSVNTNHSSSSKARGQWSVQ